MKLIRELLESTMNNYLGCTTNGGGMEYKVYDSPQDAYEEIGNDASLDFVAIVAFSGPLRSIKNSSQGEILVNGEVYEDSEIVFQKTGDNVQIDKLGLAKPD